MCILTIAIPAYNVERYLPFVLSTYESKKFENVVEVLIINDGSTDLTESIAQEYVQKYPSIFRVISKKNGGHGSAVNTGIKYAKGKYFRVIDGDDWVNTQNLELLVEFLKFTDADLVCDVKREVNSSFNQSRVFSLPATVEEKKIYTISEISCNKDICAYIMMHISTFKTSILREHNVSLLENTFYVDYEFIVKATCFSQTVQFINLEVYQYQVGNAHQSIDYRNYVKRYQQHHRVINELLLFKCYDNDAAFFYNFKVKALIETHYKILFIMMDNKKDGRLFAKSFNRQLQHDNPLLWEKTKKRYLLLFLLNLLHVSYPLFQLINGLRGR